MSKNNPETQASNVPVIHDETSIISIIWADGMEEYCFKETSMTPNNKPKVYPDGTIEWYKKPPHRIGSPARLNNDDSFEWFYKGKYHRIGGPAIRESDGSQMYYKYGKRHRDGDLPAVEYSDGTIEYYYHGELHRDNGPARITTDGTEEYWRKDRRHRIDGPAIIWSNGVKEYWIDGEEVNRVEENG